MLSLKLVLPLGAAAAALPQGGWFAPELSLAAALELVLDPPVEAWRYPIETVAKSERGLERTLQGESVTPRWAIGIGAARIELRRPPT